MILNFRDEATEDIFNGVASKKALKIPQKLWRIARRKLDMLNAAHELSDLTVPPANRLEALKGDLKDFHSIRIDDQYRLLFKWVEHSALDVRITDYH